MTRRKSFIFTLAMFRFPQISSLQVGNSAVRLASSAKNLGVIFDDSVTMSDHVSSICKSASYSLYKIGKLRRFLDQASTEKLVHAFITSRLDTCKSLLFGLPACELDKLQRIQNAAARLVSRVKGHCHMKPVLRNLHWLPVRKRIMFKIIFITFKAIHGLAPAYIRDLLNIRKPALSDHPQPHCWIILLCGCSGLIHMDIALSLLVHPLCGTNYLLIFEIFLTLTFSSRIWKLISSNCLTYNIVIVFHACMILCCHLRTMFVQCSCFSGFVHVTVHACML